MPILNLLVANCGREWDILEWMVNHRNQRTPRDGLTWEEWVKTYAKCNHCGEIGHIRPTCSKYLAAIESGQIKRPDKKGACDLG
jgi:hypothetical protein